jgi:hypothetical protein
MSHPARGPASAGIDGKANVPSRRPAKRLNTIHVTEAAP